MQTSKLSNILNSDNFSDELENYLITEINEEHLYDNPFHPVREEVSHKLLLKTIISCTLLLANIIYILHKGD